MRGLVLLLLSLLALSAVPGALQPSGDHSPQRPEPLGPTKPQVAFRAYDIWVDAGDAPVAAWQLECSPLNGELVGVEGGAAPAFRDAPRYDPAALQRKSGACLILAALSDPAEDAPRGRFRAARLHLRTNASPNSDIEILRAVGGDPTGARIALKIQCTPAEAPR